MNEEKKLLFLDRLTSLLNGSIKEKSQSLLETEMTCEAIKWKLSRIMEEIYKLDFLADDFDLSTFISENINHPIERIKEQVNKPWLKNKLTIGLMGHFNAGKTTALNLIFNENFATARRENTALATYLVSGTNTEILTLVDKGGKSQEVSIDDCSLFDYQSGMKNFPFARIFEYVVKESRNNLLEQISFIDTPGLCATNEHSEPTIQVIPNCDAIFWFVNLTGGATKSDVAFIQENIKDLPLYVVFSYVDEVENVDLAISTALQQFKHNQIEIKDHFCLGRNPKMQNEFKTTITNTIAQIATDYDIYNPYVHLYAIMCKLEELLVDCQKGFTDEFNKLNKETDKISDTYSASRAKFETAWTDCTNRINNTISTFNARCSDAMFCGGASGAIANNINSIVSSLEDIGTAYCEIDMSKLVEFGQQISTMGIFQSKIDRASELLTEIQKIKKIFD